MKGSFLFPMNLSVLILAFEQYFWRLDHPLNILLAAFCGFIFGYFFVAKFTHTHHWTMAWLFFLGVTSIQTVMTIAWAIRGFAEVSLLSYFFWLPIWAVFSLGLGWGVLYKYKKFRKDYKAKLEPLERYIKSNER